MGLGAIATVLDYAGAWSAERARCHRMVYDDHDGRPQSCPEAPVASGWKRNGSGRWFVVHATDRCHKGQLLRRPEC